MDARGVGPSGRYRLRCVVASHGNPRAYPPIWSKPRASVRCLNFVPNWAICVPSYAPAGCPIVVMAASQPPGRERPARQTRPPCRATRAPCPAPRTPRGVLAAAGFTVLVPAPQAGAS